MKIRHGEKGIGLVYSLAHRPYYRPPALFWGATANAAQINLMTFFALSGFLYSFRLCCLWIYTFHVGVMMSGGVTELHSGSENVSLSDRASPNFPSFCPIFFLLWRAILPSCPASYAYMLSTMQRTSDELLTWTLFCMLLVALWAAASRQKYYMQYKILVKTRKWQTTFKSPGEIDETKQILFNQKRVFFTIN